MKENRILGPKSSVNVMSGTEIISETTITVNYTDIQLEIFVTLVGFLWFMF